MIDTDETALICDFAETYRIYDYRSLPVRLAATLAAGFRDDSRISMSMTEAKASTTNTILAIIADRIGHIEAALDDGKPRLSIFNALYGIDTESNKKIRSFRTGQDFTETWNRINEGE